MSSVSSRSTDGAGLIGDGAMADEPGAADVAIGGGEEILPLDAWGTVPVDPSIGISAVEWKLVGETEGPSSLDQATPFFGRVRRVTVLDSAAGAGICVESSAYAHRRSKRVKEAEPSPEGRRNICMSCCGTHLAGRLGRVERAVQHRHSARAGAAGGAAEALGPRLGDGRGGEQRCLPRRPRTHGETSQLSFADHQVSTVVGLLDEPSMSPCVMLRGRLCRLLLSSQEGTWRACGRPP